VARIFAALGGEQQQLQPDSIRRTTVNGLPAAYGTARINANNGQVDLVVFAYEFSDDRAYHFQAVSAAGRADVFGPMFNSMQRISAQAAAGVVPRKIEIYTVRPGDTIAALARRLPYEQGQEARFRVLNGLGAGDTIRAGEKVKLIVRGS
jgi:predicted Zn-dependent protease